MKKKIKKAETEPKKVVILGYEISPVHKPRLYKIALENPGWVEMQVKGMMGKQGFKTPGMPLAILDSDL